MMIGTDYIGRNIIIKDSAIKGAESFYHDVDTFIEREIVFLEYAARSFNNFNADVQVSLFEKIDVINQFVFVHLL